MDLLLFQCDGATEINHAPGPSDGKQAYDIAYPRGMKLFAYMLISIH
jgi:hypothetical protein